MTDLSPRQSALVSLFEPGQDVSIEILYREFFDRAPEPHTSRREMQQQLGPYIKAINDRNGSLRIIPGVARGTYRLVPARG